MGALERGLVQVYTGAGKGKTTAAMGLAMRAVGQGMRVCVVQFLKSPSWRSGERVSAERLAPELEMHPFGAEQWGDRGEAEDGAPWWQLSPSEEDRRRAGEGIAFLRDALVSGEHDVVIADEILGALKGELVSLDDIMAIIRGRPPRVELVLTGRAAPPEIIEAADLVTEMKLVKHPYERGVEARRGIEY
jgi:cob(I)alamin adenosyltransferase